MRFVKARPAWHAHRLFPCAERKAAYPIVNRPSVQSIHWRMKFILSFPGNGHQTKYVEQLSEIVRKLVPVKKSASAQTLRAENGYHRICQQV